MLLPTIIYYGRTDLRTQVLAAYFSKLNCPVHIARGLPDLLATSRQVLRPIIILAENESASTLTRVARAIIPDLARAFPPVLILFDGETFDPKLPAVQVITGAYQLSTLTQHILALPYFAALGSTMPLPALTQRDQIQPTFPTAWDKFPGRAWRQMDREERQMYKDALRKRAQAVCSESRQLREQAQSIQAAARKQIESFPARQEQCQTLIARSIELARTRRAKRAGCALIGI